ncbi:MAG TPA: glycine-rich domain-containing protein-like [Oculatellaceae cyanobacterium]
MKVRKQVLFVENQTFQEKLESLDLELIAQKLMHSNHTQGWTQKEVDRAIARYKMFLHLLYLYPNTIIVPTQEIDQVWHQHILDTRKYAQDCQWLFGYFVHHCPDFGMGDDDQKQALETAFSDTRTLFAEHFGIDVIQDTYVFREACAILPKGQPNQSSACIVLKERSLNSPVLASN